MRPTTSATTVARSCLFCRSPLEGTSWPEHVPPESLGGWLTIHDVCNACNHKFGNEVDKVASHPILMVLRREAGLRVPGHLKVRPFDKELEDLGPWLARPDGSVDWSRDVIESGGSVTIYGQTQARARTKAEEYSARQIKRGKPPPKFGEWDKADFGVRKFVLDVDEEGVERLNTLLLREAAKIAVEYVSMIASPSVALLESLDDLRSHARDGDGQVTGGADYLGDGIRWLPRTRRFQALAMENSQRVTDEQLAEMIGNAETDDWEPPDAFPRLSRLYHHLTVQTDGRTAWFVLILFGWMRLLVRLPTDLPIPWGTYHRREFLPNRLTCGRH